MKIVLEFLTVKDAKTEVQRTAKLESKTVNHKEHEAGFQYHLTTKHNKITHNIHQVSYALNDLSEELCSLGG